MKRKRMTSGRRETDPHKMEAALEELEGILAEDLEDAEAAEEVVADAQEDLVDEAQELADEEVAVVEESSGEAVSEDVQQNERANDNWPIEARYQTAVRMLKMAKALLSED